MKKFALFIWIMLITVATKGQVTFQKTYGVIEWDNISCVQQTLDGGYIFTSTATNSSIVGYSVYLVKTNSNGDTLWSKIFGGSGNDYAEAVVETPDSGYVICGATFGFGAGAYDVYLIKTNSKGDLLWSKTYGGKGQNYGRSIQLTSDGGYIIAGETASADLQQGTTHVFLIKTKDNGDTLWTKILGLGGIKPCFGYSVQQTKDHGYIIAGTAGEVNGTNWDIYLLKTDSSGNPLWAKTIGGSDYDWGYSVQQTNDSGFIIAGQTVSFGSGNGDFYLIKTNSNGDTLWSKAYGGTDNDIGFSAKQTYDGGYAITGVLTVASTHGDVGLIKTDQSGNVVWSKIFTGTIGNESAHSLQQTTDSGYIINGGDESVGGHHAYLIKTDSLGNSGCNQNNISIIGKSSSPHVINVGTGIYYDSIIVTSPPTILGYLSQESILCFTGIDELFTNKNVITIYPNPLNSSAILELDEVIDNAQVILYDVLGREMWRKKLIGSRMEFEKGNLANGVYFIRVNNNKRQYAQTIIIQ